MIYDALLVPDENPTSLRAIKRALLAYDKVMLADPNDRDIMPSNVFPAAILGIPGFGMSMGAVRPMGKSADYDDRFEQVLEACRPAVEQGLLTVHPTYDQGVTRMGTLGSVPMGGYPLNPQFVFQVYRSMSADAGFLRDAVARDAADLLNGLKTSPRLSLDCIGDGIQNLPALPILEDAGLPSDQLTALTRIARARIGAFVKYSGYSEVREIIPVFESRPYGGLTIRLLDNARTTLAEADEDRYWFKRNRVLELCHEEFLLDAKLDDLSIDQVLRLRTHAWGKQATAREALFKSVYEIAHESGDSPQFEERAQALIVDYRKASEELIRERGNLGIKITCDLVSATLAGATSGIAGFLSQLTSPLASIGTGHSWSADFGLSIRRRPICQGFGTFGRKSKK